MKIAVWSGPRNLSTALMYSFGSRPDFAAMDEPFYAPYLAATGVEHPMADLIKSAHETDPAKVALDCADPGASTHKYMKHMPHHMLDGFPLDWTRDCIHVHLIRHPARVITSYAAKRENPTLSDLGYTQQSALFDRIGGIVVDSFDIRQNPEKTLKSLCRRLDLPFDDAMLTWPAGAKEFDGIWADHWYGVVHKSTGFAGAEGPLPQVPDTMQHILAEALPHYEKLRAFKI